MRFTKVEGAGNDYVLVDAESLAGRDPAGLSRDVSDRHRGIGSDGLLVVGPARDGAAQASMRIFNADGSEGRMCGNGLRCVVRWLAERRGLERPELLVETASGPLRGRRDADGTVTVSMGRPDFRPASLPVDLPGDGREPAGLPLPPDLPADPDVAFCVSTGNPHLVVRVHDVTGADLARYGRTLQADPRLGDGANVHLVQPESDARLLARPFERGSGATRACGTGAVAVAAVARALAWVADGDCRVAMPGGELLVRFDEQGEAWLGGPARLVFDGEWPGS